MKKWIISIFVALLLAAPIVVSADDGIDKSQDPLVTLQIEKLKEEVEACSVSLFSVGGGMSKCSGVVIRETEENTIILTARHCAPELEEMYVEDKKVLLSIISTNDDLAYLIVEGKLKDKKPAKMASERAKLKDIVYHVSFPEIGKDEIYESSGTVHRNTEDWQWLKLKSKGGCSGGGIFNIKGELVGTLWGGVAWHDVTVIEPIDNVKTFLDTIDKYIK